MSTHRSEYLRGYRDALDGKDAAPRAENQIAREGAVIRILRGGSYFKKDTRAVLTSNDGEHWRANFRGQGNMAGSFDDSIDGVWCVGTEPGVCFEVVG